MSAAVQAPDEQNWSDYTQNKKQEIWGSFKSFKEYLDTLGNTLNRIELDNKFRTSQVCMLNRS